MHSSTPTETASATSEDAGAIPHCEILGVPVSRIDLPRAVDIILDWAVRGRSNFVCVRDVHGVMRAVDSDELRRVHWRAGMVTPDGMPLVWLSRRRGCPDIARVCGPDLLDAVCAASEPLAIRHYFYGGKPGVAEELAARLRARYPGLNVVGCASPPFQKLSVTDDVRETNQIADAKPHIVWVGLGTPKQEAWMQDHVGRIPGATLIGVGAAFDIHAGLVQRAPVWMQRSGLEWLFRLLSEPTRLWHRYLVLAPRFVVLAALESTRSRRGARGRPATSAR
jgi:N-acetylglucosaminyldiphosphoundecaprenol N-acetyl-beta-D-mannosaminyltransferase